MIILYLEIYNIWKKTFLDCISIKIKKTNKMEIKHTDVGSWTSVSFRALVKMFFVASTQINNNAHDKHNNYNDIQSTFHQTTLCSTKFFDRQSALYLDSK